MRPEADRRAAVQRMLSPSAAHVRHITHAGRNCTTVLCHPRTDEASREPRKHGKERVKMSRGLLEA